MTDTYQPKIGDRVHLTVNAVVDADGYRVDHRTKLATSAGPVDVDNSHWLWPNMACIVRVEPAPREMPTEFGSYILARTAASIRPSLLTLVEYNGRSDWFFADIKSFGPVSVSSIGPDWVQIDPATMRPIEVA